MIDNYFSGGSNFSQWYINDIPVVRDIIFELPEEISIIILNMLDIESLYNCYNSSSYWKNLIKLDRNLRVSIQKYKLFLKEMRKNPNFEMNQILNDYQRQNTQINSRNRPEIQINNQINYTNSRMNRIDLNTSNNIQQRMNEFAEFNNMLNIKNTITKKGKGLKRKVNTLNINNKNVDSKMSNPSMKKKKLRL